MNKYFGTFAIILGALLFASCNKDPQGYEESNQYAQCFAYVKSIDGNEEAFTKDITYTVSINYSQAKASVKISSLKLPGGVTYPSMTFDNLPYTFNEKGWLNLAAETFTPSVAGGDQPKVTNLQFKLLPRWFGRESVPGLVMRFVIDDKYTVFSSCAYQIMGAKTVSVAAGAPEFETKVTYYGFYFDTEKQKVNIGIYKASFTESMPTRFNIIVNEVPFTLDGTEASFAIDEKIPTIGGDPYEDFKLTDISGVFDFNGSFVYNFKCAPKLPMLGGREFNVTAKGTYYDTPQESTEE